MKRIMVMLLAAVMLLSSCAGSNGEISFQAECIKIRGYTSDTAINEVSVIRSSAELDEFYNAYNGCLYLGKVSEEDQKTYSDVTRGFLDACEEYSEDFFEMNDLLIVGISAGTSSFEHEVQSVCRDKRDKDYVDITIERTLDGPPNEEAGVWLMLIETEKEAVSPEDHFFVNYIGAEY